MHATYRPRLLNAYALTVVVAIAFAYLMTVDASAQTPGLTGESLGAPASGLAITGDVGCADPTVPTAYTFQTTGVASGPYPGTFTDTSSVTIGPKWDLSHDQPRGEVTSFQSQFTINSPTGTVTGTRSLLPGQPIGSNFGACGRTANGRLNSFGVTIQQATYEATFTLPGGATFTETGTTSAMFSLCIQLCGVIDGQPNFRFTSTFVGDPTPTTITLRVATDPPLSAQVFDVTGAIVASLGHGQSATASVEAGTAQADVALPSGWGVSGVVCDDSDSGAGSQPGHVVFDTEPGDSVLCTIVFAPTNADVSITKTVDQTTVVQGGTLVYTLTATNNGPGVATHVRLIDFLPGGVSFVSAGSGCAHDGGAVGGEVVCSVGDLEAGQSAARLVRVNAGSPQIVSNFAGVSSVSSDPDPSDNATLAVTTTITSVTPNPCQSGTGNELWAFGNNGAKQLGISWTGSAVTPKPVNLLTDVADVASSQSDFTLVRRGDGLVCSFGSASLGRLGRPPTVAPGPVLTDSGAPLSDVVFVEVYRHSAHAIVDPDGDGAGALWSWGVVPGSPAGGYQRATQIQLPPGVELVDVAGSDSANGLGGWTALGSNGLVYRWQNGTGPIATAVPLAPGERPIAVEAGVLVTDHHRLFLFCNSVGPPCPTLGWVAKATAPGPIIDIETSDSDSHGVLLVDGNVDGAGDVYAWNGTWGDGSINSTDPSLTRLSRADLPEEVVDVAAGYNHSVVAGVSGRVFGWGAGYYGSLDNGGTHLPLLYPIEIGGFANADLVDAGGSGTFVAGDLATVPPLTEGRNFDIQSAGMPGGNPLADGTDTEGDGATATDPLETTVSLLDGPFVLNNKSIWINETPVDAAIAPNIIGYQAWGQMVTLATTTNPSAPFVLDFALYLTPSQRAVEQTFGGYINGIAVIRNQQALPACAVGPPSFAPDPCVVSRSLNPANGNARIRVLTTNLSTWMFEIPSPIVDAGGPYQAVEGTPLTLNGDVISQFLPDIRWTGDAGLADSTVIDAVFTGKDNGLAHLTLTAGAGDVISADDAEITVTNANPVIGSATATPPSPVSGTPVQLAVTFTDRGVADTHAVTISWGDTSPVTTRLSTAPGGGTVTAGHPYAAAGTYTVTVTVADDDGGSATTTRIVTVTAVVPVNPAPTVFADMGVTGLNEIGFQTNVVVVTGSFTDPNGPGPYKASVRWTATGPFSNLALSNNSQFVAGQIYGSAGVRVVTVRICDALGACGTDDVTVRTAVTQKITPVIQCVVDRGGAVNPRYQARWGYNNPAPFAIAVASIPTMANTFTTAPYLRGQPQIFLSGQRRGVFTTTFATGNHTWQVNGNSATAKTTSPRC